MNAWIILIILNVLAFWVFVLDQKNSERLTFGSLVELLISITGGAAGGYLAMAITGNKSRASLFKMAMPLFVGTQFVLFLMSLMFIA